MKQPILIRFDNFFLQKRLHCQTRGWKCNLKNALKYNYFILFPTFSSSLDLERKKVMCKRRETVNASTDLIIYREITVFVKKKC